MGREIRVVTETELREAIDLDLTTIDVVEKAFVALARGDVVMPPIMSMDLHQIDGEVDVKTAFIPGFDHFAVKASTGFYGNAVLGMPSLGGLMVALSAKTGAVEAVFLDNGYLTDLRTAAAGAVAAKYLAPKIVKTAGVIGTGLQARAQMQAAHMMRPFSKLLIWGRDAEKAAACAGDLAAMLDIDAKAVTDPAQLVAESQLVVTTTPAHEPVLRAEWLHPGLHITAMGSDAEAKNEIDPAALVRADAYVCDRVSQCEVLGELRSAIEAGLWAKGAPAELGQVVTGQAAGRVAESDITVCDLTGTGAQDTAIAAHVYAALQGSDVGTVITT